MIYIKKPFANTGDKTPIPFDTVPSGEVSFEQGYTADYQADQTSDPNAKDIERAKFNWFWGAISENQKAWQEKTFPDWISDKGDGTPFAYPKNAIVRYTDGNSYVSKVDNNSTIPTDTNNWVNFEDFGGLNINSLPEKTTPENTDNLALQETGGLLKKVSFENLTKLSPNDNRVKTALNASGDAPIYACRAWVNFNGTETVAIRASGNVSSITDNGVGDYTVNFTTAMSDANYAVSGAGGGLSNTPAYLTYDTRTTTSVRVGNKGIYNAYHVVDGVEQSVTIFR